MCRVSVREPGLVLPRWLRFLKGSMPGAPPLGGLGVHPWWSGVLHNSQAWFANMDLVCLRFRLLLTDLMDSQMVILISVANLLFSCAWWLCQAGGGCPLGQTKHTVISSSTKTQRGGARGR